MSIGTLLYSLLAIVISLAFVVALAWGTLWLLKRFQDGSFGRLSGAETGPSLRFEKSLPIGPRERLVLVEVEGEQMLLGVTAHSITPIKSWPSGKTEPTVAAPAQETASGPMKEAAKRFRLRMAGQDGGDGHKDEGA